MVPATGWSNLDVEHRFLAVGTHVLAQYLHMRVSGPSLPVDLVFVIMLLALTQSRLQNTDHWHKQRFFDLALSPWQSLAVSLRASLASFALHQLRDKNVLHCVRRD